MNEEMLADQVAQLETDLRIMRTKKEYYEQFFSPCKQIYYGRIAMDNQAVIAGIEAIEKLLREKNMN